MCYGLKCEADWIEHDQMLRDVIRIELQDIYLITARFWFALRIEVINYNELKVNGIFTSLPFRSLNLTQGPPSTL